jgi:hypothetical protein
MMATVINAGVAQLVEQLICNHQVRGSSPCAGTKVGGLAQLGERLICIQEVSGSIPLSSTNLIYEA